MHHSGLPASPRRKAFTLSGTWFPAGVRDGDVVCRIGGDEFVILLPDITDDEAAAVARRIIAGVAEPFEFAPAARVGASIGRAAQRRRSRDV